MLWDLLITECEAGRIVVSGVNTLPEESKWHFDKMNEILRLLKE